MALVMPAPTGQAFAHAVGPIAVHPAASGAEDQGSVASLPDVEVQDPRSPWGNGTVTCLPPLRMTFSVRWSRSKSRSPTWALRASLIRNPLSANSDASAASLAEPRPAWTKNAASSLWSSPSVRESVVHPRPTHVEGWVSLDEPFLLAVAVEAHQGGQPPGHRSSACGRSPPSTGRIAPGASGGA